MATKKTSSKKTTGKRLRTGGNASTAEAAPEEPTPELSEPSDDDETESAAASGLAAARARAARVPKPVKGAYVPTTPIRYKPKGGDELKTEMPTTEDGKPNVLTDISDLDLDAFFASGAIEQHVTY